MRIEMIRLRNEGEGANLLTARGTLWGALNAVTEFVDHDAKMGQISASLLGSGHTLKKKAYQYVLKLAEDPSTSI